MKRLKSKDILFVGLQVLLFILFFLVPSNQGWYLASWIRVSFFAVAIIGLFVAAISIFQLRRNLSPFPTPVSQGTLIQSGLYKNIRHPVYTGMFLFFLAYAIGEQSLFKLFIAFLLLVLFYCKSRYEEKLLVEKFPEYKQYQKRSYRFFPFL